MSKCLKHLLIFFSSLSHSVCSWNFSLYMNFFCCYSQFDFFSCSAAAAAAAAIKFFSPLVALPLLCAMMMVWLYFGSSNAFCVFSRCEYARQMVSCWLNWNRCWAVCCECMCVSGNIDCKQIWFLSIQWMSAQYTSIFGCGSLFLLLILRRHRRRRLSFSVVKVNTWNFELKFNSIFVVIVDILLLLLLSSPSS